MNGLPRTYSRLHEDDHEGRESTSQPFGEVPTLPSSLPMILVGGVGGELENGLRPVKGHVLSRVNLVTCLSDVVASRNSRVVDLEELSPCQALAPVPNNDQRWLRCLTQENAQP